MILSAAAAFVAATCPGVDPNVASFARSVSPQQDVAIGCASASAQNVDLCRLGEALFLCLPGNPVSVLATYLTLGRTLLDALQGRAEPRPRLRARLGTAWHKTHDRLEFLRGRLAYDNEGRLHVEPNPADGSHRMRAAADSG